MGVTYSVIQVSDLVKFVSNGFSSGSPTTFGSFQYQFNQPGTYYYWSGFVESSDQIMLKGVVVVQNSVDKLLTIGVSLNGLNGMYNT